MTRTEAIDRIREHMEIHKLNEPRAVKITEALNMAIEVLKEEQPKKVKDFQYLADLFVGKCPSCGEELNNEVYPAFCGFCGQRISWKAGAQE